MTGTFSFRNHSAAWKSWAFPPWGQLQLFKMYVDNVQRIYAVGMRCDDLGGRFYCWFSIFFCFDHGDHGSTQILVAISDSNFRHKQNTWNELAWQHSRLARNHPLISQRFHLTAGSLCWTSCWHDRQFVTIAESYFAAILIWKRANSLLQTGRKQKLSSEVWLRIAMPIVMMPIWQK